MSAGATRKNRLPSCRHRIYHHTYHSIIGQSAPDAASSVLMRSVAHFSAARPCCWMDRWGPPSYGVRQTALRFSMLLPRGLSLAPGLDWALSCCTSAWPRLCLAGNWLGPRQASEVMLESCEELSASLQRRGFARPSSAGEGVSAGWQGSAAMCRGSVVLEVCCALEDDTVAGTWHCCAAWARWRLMICIKHLRP